MKTQDTTLLNQTFVCKAASASRIFLVGDFTHWMDAPIPMRSSGKGTWKTTVPLAPGEYHYAFLVDGKHGSKELRTLRVAEERGNAVRQEALS